MMTGNNFQISSISISRTHKSQMRLCFGFGGKTSSLSFCYVSSLFSCSFPRKSSFWICLTQMCQQKVLSVSFVEYMNPNILKRFGAVFFRLAAVFENSAVDGSEGYRQGEVEIIGKFRANYLLKCFAVLLYKRCLLPRNCGFLSCLAMQSCWSAVLPFEWSLRWVLRYNSGSSFLFFVSFCWVAHERPS